MHFTSAMAVADTEVADVDLLSTTCTFTIPPWPVGSR
jgi:hypothetical protein